MSPVSRYIVLARTTKKIVTRLENFKKYSILPLLESQMKQKKRYTPESNVCFLLID